MSPEVWVCQACQRVVPSRGTCHPMYTILVEPHPTVDESGRVVDCTAKRTQEFPAARRIL